MERPIQPQPDAAMVPAVPEDPIPPVNPAWSPPVHPLSSGLLLLVDNLWNLADWAVLDWILTIPLSFLSVAVPVYFIQRRAHRDPRLRAASLALILGLVAAIPTSITGTPVGAALLAWTGIHRWKHPLK